MQLQAPRDGCVAFSGVGTAVRLKHATQRPGAIFRFITLASQGFSHGGINLEHQSLFLKQASQILELEPHNADQISHLQRPKADLFVNAIQKFGAEMRRLRPRSVNLLLGGNGLVERFLRR